MHNFGIKACLRGMLEDVKEGVDYRNATALVDDREIDSFDILAIISAIDDEFDAYKDFKQRRSKRRREFALLALVLA